MTKESKDPAFLISKLQLGHDEMSFKDYLILKGEDIIQAGYCVLELFHMALVQRMEPLGLDLNPKLLDSFDFDERPPRVVKLANAQHHARLLATSSIDNPLEFTPIDVMKLHANIKGAQ